MASDAHLICLLLLTGEAIEVSLPAIPTFAPRLLETSNLELIQDFVELEFNECPPASEVLDFLYSWSLQDVSIHPHGVCIITCTPHVSIFYGQTPYLSSKLIYSNFLEACPCIYFIVTQNPTSDCAPTQVSKWHHRSCHLLVSLFQPIQLPSWTLSFSPSSCLEFHPQDCCLSLGCHHLSYDSPQKPHDRSFSDSISILPGQ